MENKHTRSVSLIDGHIEEMTDAEIIKALECCIHSASREDCEDLQCPACEKQGCYFNNISAEDYPECLIEGMSVALIDLINRQQAEIKQLETIERVATKTIEKQSAEIEKLNVELVGMRGACESYKMHYDNAQAEVERYEQLIPNKYCVCTRVGNGLIYSESSEDYDKIIGEISSEAIKEFWKRFDKVLCENIGPSKRVYWKISSDGDNLVKEMTEVKKIENTENN